jgi:exodeoxyribonuclease VII small subunit
MAAKPKQINYQALTEELDQIIAKIQDETTSIDDALDLYERGVGITKLLEEYLASAQNRLIKISKIQKEV